MEKLAERRRFWRAVFKSSVIIQDSEGTFSAELIDISLNGALVSVPSFWQGRIGQSVELDLALDDQAQIVMSTTVRHIEGLHVGLRCESIDLDSISHLRRLVELNSGDPVLLQREFTELIRIDG